MSAAKLALIEDFHAQRIAREKAGTTSDAPPIPDSSSTKRQGKGGGATRRGSSRKAEGRPRPRWARGEAAVAPTANRQPGSRRNRPWGKGQVSVANFESGGARQARKPSSTRGSRARRSGDASASAAAAADLAAATAALKASLLQSRADRSDLFFSIKLQAVARGFLARRRVHRLRAAAVAAWSRRRRDPDPAQGTDGMDDGGASAQAPVGHGHSPGAARAAADAGVVADRVAAQRAALRAKLAARRGRGQAARSDQPHAASRHAVLRQQCATAATAINAACRGHLARQRVSALRHQRRLHAPALTVQRAFRAFVCRRSVRKAVARRRDCATHVQRTWRGRCGRLLALQVASERLCCITIQRVARGMLGRRRAVAVAHEARLVAEAESRAARLERERLCSITIQRVARGMLGRRRVRSQVTQPTDPRDVSAAYIDAARCHAAACVQRAWLRYRRARQHRSELAHMLHVQDRLSQLRRSIAGRRVASWFTAAFRARPSRRRGGAKPQVPAPQAPTPTAFSAGGAQFTLGQRSPASPEKPFGRVPMRRRPPPIPAPSPAAARGHRGGGKAVDGRAHPVSVKQRRGSRGSSRRHGVEAVQHGRRDVAHAQSSAAMPQVPAQLHQQQRPVHPVASTPHVASPSSPGAAFGFAPTPDASASPNTRHRPRRKRRHRRKRVPGHSPLRSPGHVGAPVASPAPLRKPPAVPLDALAPQHASRLASRTLASAPNLLRASMPTRSPRHASRRRATSALDEHPPSGPPQHSSGAASWDWEREGRPLPDRFDGRGGLFPVAARSASRVVSQSHARAAAVVEREGRHTLRATRSMPSLQTTQPAHVGGPYTANRLEPLLPSGNDTPAGSTAEALPPHRRPRKGRRVRGVPKKHRRHGEMLSNARVRKPHPMRLLPVGKPPM